MYLAERRSYASGRDALGVSRLLWMCFWGGPAMNHTAVEPPSVTRFLPQLSDRMRVAGTCVHRNISASLQRVQRTNDIRLRLQDLPQRSSNPLFFSLNKTT